MTGYNCDVKTIFSIICAFAIATVAAAQNLSSVQESGDIFADCGRVQHSDGTTTLVSPFNYGFVNSPTSPLLSAIFQNVSSGSGSSTVYNPDELLGHQVNLGVTSQSALLFNFSSSSVGFASGYSFNMQAEDFIPCVEVKLPKGTYTFQATATPLDGTSTPGTFEFATLTEGIWTVQFNLALPKAEGATRTLTFAHDTRVRWMLINTPGNFAFAAITARYYNSGS